MDMRIMLNALRETLDDLAMTLENEGEVEATVSITSNGAGLLRTRAFFDNVRVQFNASGEGHVRTFPGEHLLTWDVQGPRNAPVRIIVEADGLRVADEGGNLGDDGRDGGSVRFTIG